MSDNFSATKPGQVVPVTTAAALHALNADSRHATDALLDNRGSSDAYILFCGSDGTVDKATGVRVIAGTLIALGKGSATHIAVIGDGATSLTLHYGKGV
ncbi:UNVERIFIED_ORG: hypothetical protein LHJ69_14240 [Shinella sp. XGS7]|nr:hypothetical protein [Shinella sp. XGS7]